MMCSGTALVWFEVSNLASDTALASDVFSGSEMTIREAVSRPERVFLSAFTMRDHIRSAVNSVACCD